MLLKFTVIFRLHQRLLSVITFRCDVFFAPGGAEYGVDGTVIGFAVLYRDGGSTAAFLGEVLCSKI